MSPSSIKLITNFKSLSYDAKLQKVKTMLDALQEVWGILAEFKKLIQINNRPENTIIEMIYVTIIQTADQIQQQIHDSKMQEFVDIRQALDKIKVQEKADQWNTDDILDQL